MRRHLVAGVFRAARRLATGRDGEVAFGGGEVAGARSVGSRNRRPAGAMVTGSAVSSIKPEHVIAYSRAPNVSVATLYGRLDNPLRVAHEWLVADTPAERHTVAGRRVGPSLASELERRVIDLRHLDDVIGGGDLIPLVRRELTDAERVVNESSYTEDTGRRLLTVVGELAQLAGWVASDAGQYTEAQQVYLSGVSAAQDAGNRALAGQLLSSLSYQMANVGDPADAALLARSAVKGANGSTPVVRRSCSNAWHGQALARATPTARGGRSMRLTTPTKPSPQVSKNRSGFIGSTARKSTCWPVAA